MTPPQISFEFFPPKNLESSFRLWDTVQVLAPLEPRFISVTYGAGGTTRDLTRDAVSTLHKSSGLRVAAHLTCVNASRQETVAVARSFAAAGISDIVALRGDPPKGVDGFTPHPEGFQTSLELISALVQSGDFTLRVAAYPESHPEAEDAKRHHLGQRSELRRPARWLPGSQLHRISQRSVRVHAPACIAWRRAARALGLRRCATVVYRYLCI